MRNPDGFTVPLLLASFLGACSPSVYTLRMVASRPPIDESAVSPRLVASRYTKIMVIPPSGSARGQFDSTISIFEAEFLKLGITVISGAVTGRVVLSNEIGTDEKRVEGAAQLSDAERALIMAKKTGAHAVLQVGEFGWTDRDEPPDRYFVADQASLQYREVDEGALQSVPPQFRWVLSAPRLRFIGKLIDVESGEVIASFKIAAASNGCVRSDYVSEHRISGDRAEFASENYTYAAEVQSSAAKDRCIQAVVQSVAHHIGSGAVAAGPLPPQPMMPPQQYAPPPQGAPPPPPPPPPQQTVAPAPAPMPPSVQPIPAAQPAPLAPPPQYVPAPVAPAPVPAKATAPAAGPARGAKPPPPPAPVR
jgi:hypothetical protein